MSDGLDALIARIDAAVQLRDAGAITRRVKQELEHADDQARAGPGQSDESGEDDLRRGWGLGASRLSVARPFQGRVLAELKAATRIWKR